MRIASAFALLFLALCPTAQATAQVVYVDCNAPGPGHDGTSWDAAFLTIQEGVNVATPGRDVWVADGTYVENVAMGEGVQLYGGFLGAEPGGYETSLDQRDWVNHVATIDGNQAGSCVAMAVDARVDGFTLTNGAGALYGDRRYGGGVYCGGLGAGGAIANNFVTGNVADYAGAVFCDYSSPTLANNAITGNSAWVCGGIYCGNSSPTITGNTISGNSTDMYGGGISCSYSSPTITLNTITGNSAFGSGGIYCDHSSPTITLNTISNNWADHDTGGISCCWYSSATITLNTINGNSGYYYAGGIYCSYSSPIIACNTITENSAEHSSGSGGGISCDSSSLTVTGNELSGNSASRGGGIYCHSSSLTVSGNVVSGNYADYQGGGIWCDSSSLIAADNTISGNSSDCGGGVYCCSASSPTLTGNRIIGNTADSDGGGMDCYSSTPIMDDNTISGNSATRGGGIYCYGRTWVVTGNGVSGNSAAKGGGIYYDKSWPTLSSTTIRGNSATEGGGMYCDSSWPILASIAIRGNSATNGGGIYFDDSVATLTNAAIVGNSATSGAALSCDSDDQRHPSDLLITNCILWNVGDEVWNNDESVLAITYSDVQGGWPAEGNIDADPMSADPAAGDFHLAAGSPCVDQGTNSPFGGLPDVDWEGDDRIINGTADIGADEYVTIYTEAPVPQPGCGGALFGGSQAGFPAWVWFSIPLTPDCVVGSGCGDPNTLLGFDCKGKLWYWDKYGKFPQVYQPPFTQWDLAVGNSYLLRLTDPVTNPSYDALSPFIPWTFEFRLGRQGWTWVGMPGLAELAGDDFMASVKVQYPSDDAGDLRTAQQDYDAIPDNWVTWGWPFYDTYLQAPKTFTPYAPFGSRTCYPWIGYRCWVKVGSAMDEDDPDQVTLIWPKVGQ